MKNKMAVSMLFIGAFALAVAGCAKRPATDDKVLAEVSNRSITLSELKSKISKVPAYYQAVVNSNKKRFLDEMILEKMFYEEAVREGLDKDKEAKEVISEAKKKILIAKLIKNEVEDKIRIPEAETKLFYESHRDDFKTPEMWRASHILVGTEKEARDILDELSKGAKFEEIAKARSTDATATRGGDVGFFRAGQLVPDFEKACLALNIGETSGIVHTQFGYHIIKLTDKREPAIEPYEKVRRSIEDILKKKKRSELFDRLVANLKNKYNVKIHEDVFESLGTLDADKNTARER